MRCQADETSERKAAACCSPSVATRSTSVSICSVGRAVLGANSFGTTEPVVGVVPLGDRAVTSAEGGRIRCCRTNLPNAVVERLRQSAFGGHAVPNSETRRLLNQKSQTSEHLDYVFDERPVAVQVDIFQRVSEPTSIRPLKAARRGPPDEAWRSSGSHQGGGGRKPALVGRGNGQAARPANANRAARRAMDRTQGKQPGSAGLTLSQVIEPDVVIPLGRTGWVPLV